MTVADMRSRMSNAEYVLWSRFYLQRASAIELERLKLQAKAGA